MKESVENYKSRVRRKDRKESSHGIRRLLNEITIVTESYNPYDQDEDKTMLFWQIGKLLRNELLTINKPDKRKELIKKLSLALAQNFGQEFNEKNLKRMIEFSLCFSDPRTATLLAQNLTWEHFRQLIKIRNPLKRNFYAELCRMKKLTAEELAEKIDSMVFESVSISSDHRNSSEKRLLDALRGENKSISKFIYDNPSILDI